MSSRYSARKRCSVACAQSVAGGDLGELRGEVLGAQVEQPGEIGAAALDGGVGDVEPVGEGAEAQALRPFLVEDPQGGDGDGLGGRAVQRH